MGRGLPLDDSLIGSSALHVRVPPFRHSEGLNRGYRMSNNEAKHSLLSIAMVVLAALSAGAAGAEQGCAILSPRRRSRRLPRSRLRSTTLRHRRSSGWPYHPTIRSSK